MDVTRFSSKEIQKYKDQFIELYKQLIGVDYPEKVDKEILTHSDFEKRIEKLIGYVERGEGIVFAALDHDIVYGYAHGYIRPFLNEKRMMLDGIVVDSNSRKMNIGKELLSMIEISAKENGCDFLELFVTTNNSVAENFYRKQGFIDSRLHMIKSL